ERSRRAADTILDARPPFRLLQPLPHLPMPARDRPREETTRRARPAVPDRLAKWRAPNPAREFRRALFRLARATSRRAALPDRPRRRPALFRDPRTHHSSDEGAAGRAPDLFARQHFPGR